MLGNIQEKQNKVINFKVFPRSIQIAVEFLSMLRVQQSSFLISHPTTMYSEPSNIKNLMLSSFFMFLHASSAVYRCSLSPSLFWRSAGPCAPLCVCLHLTLIKIKHGTLPVHRQSCGHGGNPGS